MRSQRSVGVAEFEVLPDFAQAANFAGIDALGPTFMEIDTLQNSHSSQHPQWDANNDVDIPTCGAVNDPLFNPDR